MTTAVGYASSSHAGLHFGLGTASRSGPRRGPVAVGHATVIENVKTNQVIEIREK